MISQEVKSLFDGKHTCWMATVDASGIPNVAPMRNVWWFDERSIVIGDMFMKATAANVRSTGQVCLGVYDPDTERSWKLTGTATYETDGPGYELAQAELQKKKPGNHFKGVVVLNVQAVYDQAPGPNAGNLVVSL